jgi:hypothetical protein
VGIAFSFDEKGGILPRALSSDRPAGAAGCMTVSKGSLLHQQALTVMGLFTGLTLTALVLILNSASAFHTPIGPLSGAQYFGLVSTFVAVVGAVSSVAIIAFLEVAGGIAPTFSFVDKLGTTLFFVSVFGFMGVLPLLLAPFTTWGATVLLVLEVVLLGTYFVGRLRPTVDPRAGSNP